MTEGAKFFDESDHFEKHQTRHSRGQGPVETMEKPLFLELLGAVNNQTVLDLGSGDGSFGVELLQKGATAYTGLDASEKMIRTARQNLAGHNATLFHHLMETWTFPSAHFEVIISRLALHYVEDLPTLFAKVHHALRAQGRFIFSMIHPVITSSDQSRAGGQKRQSWEVDHYFEPGPRRVFFLGKEVRQFHRPLEDIFAALQAASLKILTFREARPDRKHFATQEEFERRSRIPLFVFFDCEKEMED
jgi:SAM-dependent methyltransferase